MTSGQGNAKAYLDSIKEYSHVKHGFEKPFDMDKMLETVKTLLYDES